MPEVLVENVVRLPIVNPRSGRASRSFELMGKVDLVELLARCKRITDYKTGDPPRIISRLNIGHQREVYALAVEHTHGVMVNEIAFRIVARPSLKYCRPTFKYAVMREGRKTALKVFDDEATAEKFATMQNGEAVERISGDATRDAYEARCYIWLTENPDRIVEHSLFLTQARLERARLWLWESCKRLLECRRCERWLENENACFAYERPCPYLPLCECRAEGGDVGWFIEEQYEPSRPHRELGEVPPNGKIVTYSSLTCLGLCEVKYYWRYERCLVSARNGDTDAMWTGSAMHAGLGAYPAGGQESAFAAIDEWADGNPVLGEDAAWKQDQQIARARAMVRAAAVKWPMESAP